MDGNFAEFERVYPQRYEPKYGFWRPPVALAAEKFLKCGDLREGFARVHCDGCGHDLFVSFSCKNFAARCKIYIFSACRKNAYIPIDEFLANF